MGHWILSVTESLTDWLHSKRRLNWTYVQESSSSSSGWNPFHFTLWHSLTLCGSLLACNNIIDIVLLRTVHPGKQIRSRLGITGISRTCASSYLISCFCRLELNPSSVSASPVCVSSSWRAILCQRRRICHTQTHTILLREKWHSFVWGADIFQKEKIISSSLCFVLMRIFFSFSLILSGGSPKNLKSQRNPRWVLGWLESEYGPTSWAWFVWSLKDGRIPILPSDFTATTSKESQSP